jgi:alpha-mannosidase
LADSVARERDAALAALSASLGGDLLFVNPTPFSRNDLAFIPGELPAIPIADGKLLTVQPVEGGTLIDPGELPAYSVTPLAYGVERLAVPVAGASSRTPYLENDYLLVEFNEQGDITRIYDKTASREVLAQNVIANQFQAFEDRPKDFDAWDIDIFYDDKTYFAESAASVKLVESGPLRWTVEVKRKMLNSEITQRISLRHNSPRLDFDTTVNWCERHTMLKVAFPVEVFSPVATYEIQWGNVQRPTHKNTSWDWARFETCAHKWVDLSEGGYGVSLLNDCKYGHDIHDNVIRLTLLRSPTMPDPMADFGEQHFTYSLYPHLGGWDEKVQAEAYALNDPIISYQSSVNNGKLITRHLSLVTCSAPNVVIETVKRAEDGDGIIVRLYESQRKRGQVSVRFASAVKAAWATNLLEENESAPSVENDSIHLNLKPYQIVTLRVKLK